ncbi:MAG: Rieske 2Fe-2S domain-containing protein [Actinobacteria bacterium]|nr:Rieske 2Fe-2S domain-containing protein [Actinomycetota bacterium]
MSISSIKAANIPPGSGVAGQIGDRPVAIYNSVEGLIVLENICTHMGCETDWNPAEETWDCPCHGSRYHPDGTVLRGPAAQALTKLGYSIQDGEIVLD